MGALPRYFYFSVSGGDLGIWTEKENKQTKLSR